MSEAYNNLCMHGGAGFVDKAIYLDILELYNRIYALNEVLVNRQFYEAYEKRHSRRFPEEIKGAAEDIEPKLDEVISILDELLKDC